MLPRGFSAGKMHSCPARAGGETIIYAKNARINGARYMAGKEKSMEKISDKLWSWASILERETREQARRASTMPFIYPRYVLMPDAHLGKGATVGSGIPTVEAIMPAAV